MLKRMMTVATMVFAVTGAMAVTPLLSTGALAQQSHESRAKTVTSDLSMVDENDVKGAAIRNLQGQKIGSVDHVVMDQATGRVAFAVVGVGGFLGMGQKEVAVPWNRIQASDQSRSYTLNVDKQALQNAPAVDMKNLQALAEPSTQRQITAWWQNPANQQAQTPGNAPAAGQ
jgi:sporulation protein YlmC with PRC-barrel domain